MICPLSLSVSRGVKCAKPQASYRDHFIVTIDLQRKSPRISSVGLMRLRREMAERGNSTAQDPLLMAAPSGLTRFTASPCVAPLPASRGEDACLVAMRQAAT